ncbi:MAG: RND transporter [Thiohalophilus sp.]
MKWLDKIPFPTLIIIAILLGLAPFSPQPHLLEKLQMLFAGTLSKPIDIFDLVLHGGPLVLLAIKTVRHFKYNN